jgi:penicillin-binding protein 1A
LRPHFSSLHQVLIGNLQFRKLPTTSHNQNLSRRSNFLAQPIRVSIVNDNKSYRYDPQRRSNRTGKDTNSTSLRRLGRFLSRAALVLGAVGVIAVALGYAYLMQLIPQTPAVDNLQQVRMMHPSIVYSADGQHLTTFRQAYQEVVSLSQISPHAVNALIATEDHRFYEHPGVDIKRTLAAIFHTASGDAQGGSTITQQLARNLFPAEIGRIRSLERKLKEIITAVKIEQAYTKQQILEIYLNTVPFLYSVVGIEMAARTYFDKSAADLDVLESATLIGMLKGTSYYNPVLNPQRAHARRNVVLGQMVKYGMLDESKLESMREQPLHVELHRQADPPSSAPHFTAHLRKWLINWAEENNYNLYTDGLIIHSTLDDQLQQAAAQAVEKQTEALQNIADVEWSRKSAAVLAHSPSVYAQIRKKAAPFKYFWEQYPELENAFITETAEFKKAVQFGKSEAQALASLKSDAKFMRQLREHKTRLEAGFVAMDPATGEVKAWVGSRDFQRDQFDHVALAMRQPGSTFKPIVYGAALELGLRPNRPYLDNIVEIRSIDGSIWKPTDMSGISGRSMSMREGLIFSKNTITAQVMLDTGLHNIISLAEALGINQSRLEPVPSLALGTSPVTLLEMVSAYSTIARLGEYREPILIKRITDRHGKVLAQFGGEPQRAMSQETAVELIDMMRGVVRQGTGTDVRNRFNIVADIAGKTGTTQYNTDGWFILMHPNLVAGAWVGFNDARVTMRSDHWGQGGHNAVLLVGDFFRDTLKAKRIDVKAQFPKPKRSEPLMVKAPVDDWASRPYPDNEMPPPGYGVITRSDGSSVVIGPYDAEPAAPPVQPGNPVTAEALNRILTGMGRNPITGERTVQGNGADVISSGNSGNSGSTTSSRQQRQPPARSMPAPQSERFPSYFPESLRW